MDRHEGGCLCGALRYETLTPPLRVTTCHCRFCQQATGSAYLVEPQFATEAFRITRGTPKTWTTVSDGSGKEVYVHFCPECGTKIYLSFERLPDIIGVYGGTFDDAFWFEIGPDNSRHIFVGEARPDTVIPAGVPTYDKHIATRDGTPNDPVIYAEPHPVGRHGG